MVDEGLAYAPASRRGGRRSGLPVPRGDRERRRRISAHTRQLLPDFLAATGRGIDPPVRPGPEAGREGRLGRELELRLRRDPVYPDGRRVARSNRMPPWAAPPTGFAGTAAPSRVVPRGEQEMARPIRIIPLDSPRQDRYPMRNAFDPFCKRVAKGRQMPTTPRDSVTYDLMQGRRVAYRGTTNDPDRREQEHSEDQDG